MGWVRNSAGKVYWLQEEGDKTKGSPYIFPSAKDKEAAAQRAPVDRPKDVAKAKEQALLAETGGLKGGDHEHAWYNPITDYEVIGDETNKNLSDANRASQKERMKGWTPEISQRYELLAQKYAGPGGWRANALKAGVNPSLVEDARAYFNSSAVTVKEEQDRMAAVKAAQQKKTPQPSNTAPREEYARTSMQEIPVETYGPDKSNPLFNEYNYGANAPSLIKYTGRTLDKNHGPEVPLGHQSGYGARERERTEMKPEKEYSPRPVFSWVPGGAGMSVNDKR